MTEKLQVILQEIENGKRKYLYDLSLTKEELLTKDKDGIYFLEHLLKNKMPISHMLNVLKNNAEIAYIFCKNNKSIYQLELDENTIFSNINGKRLIDYILETNKLNYNIVSAIKEHIEIIDLISSYNSEYMLHCISPEIIEKLMTKNEKGVYLIEKYLNNDKILKQIIPLIDDTNKLIDICKKYNNYDLMEYVNEKVLMSHYNKDNTIFHYLINEKNIIPNILNKIPNNLIFIRFLMENNFYDYLKKANEEIQLLKIESEKILLEILIEKGYKPEINFISKKKTIEILYKNNMLDLIRDVSDDILLTSAEYLLKDESIGNKTFLEYMLDNGYKLYFSDILNKDIIKILYKKQKFDLLVKADIKELLEPIDDNNTYFDYILDCIKENKLKADIQEFTYFINSIDDYVKYYLIIAKHDMMEYVSEVKAKDLLKEYDGITLLNGLLNADSDLTLNKILTKSVKLDPQIAVILNSRGLKQENADISSEKNNYTRKYLEEANNSLGIGPLPEEGEFLLNQLQQLFLSDDKSDQELISALISGYRHSLFINYNVNIEELKKMIEAKQKNFNRFYYIKEEDSGYFSPSKGSIFCDSAVVEIILHETGHALHYYLAQNDVPESYQVITERARKNHETLKKVEEYADRFYQLKQKVELLVEQKYKNFFKNYYNEEKRKEIKNNLAKSKNEKKEEYSSLGILKEQLEIILENMFTEEEYIAHQKRIFIKENVDAIIRSEFGALMAIGDILDAIYEGNLHSENQKNQQGEKIKKTPGHGIYYYYNNTSHGFDEMIANFASISKSKDSKEMLQLLKEIVGDELYSMISDFYYQNIVQLNKEQLEAEKKVGGKNEGHK